MRSLVAFVCGLVFALGLGLGQMTRPGRVIAFLDVAGAWDPRLALVMLGAVVVTLVAFPSIIAFRTSLALPTRRDVDLRLLLGAGTFGVGWGLAGYCPGPALVSLATGTPAVVVFVAAMLFGLYAGGRVERSLAGAPATEPTATRESDLDLLLTKDQALAAEIDALATDGVAFVGCSNTVKAKNVGEKDLAPKSKIVDSGVAELVRRQEEGWSYIKLASYAAQP